MPANNTPVGTNIEKDASLVSRIKEGIENVTQKARNTVGGLVVGATALTGTLATPVAVGVTSAALSENAEAATIVLGTGLSNSTVSGPVKISGLAGEATTLIDEQNSYLADSGRRHSDVSLSAFTINLAEADIGPSGGIITITGRLQMSTSANFNIVDNPGVGYAGLNYRLLQHVTWGTDTSSMSQIGNSLDSGWRPNGGALSFTTGEAWLGTQDFTATFPITTAGVKYLGHEFSRFETSGGATLEGFQIDYAAVPEPSSALLAGGAIGAGLLRRRRENKNSK